MHILSIKQSWSEFFRDFPNYLKAGYADLTHMQLFLSIAFYFLIGGATAYIAKQRGRDPIIWFIIGLFLGIFGILLLFILPPVVEEGQQTNEPPAVNSSTFQAPAITHDYLVKDWYYYDGERTRQGPIRFEELRELWKASQINEESFVWSDGMSGWQKIEQVQNLYSHLKN